MDLVVRLMAGAAIALPCGLSAYLPLLVLSVAGLGKKVTLYAPFDFLGTWPVLLVIALLLGLDIFLDKLPNMQRYNVPFSRVMRPLAGGLGFAALVSPDLLFPGISFVLGAVLAEIMRMTKSNLRGGMLNSSRNLRLFEPFIATALDGVAVVLAILALAAPIAAFPLALLVLAGLWFWQSVLRRNPQRQEVIR